MPRPSDIIDFLPPLVEGVDRRDLEQRLKRLRAEDLYPPARRVGDRKAMPITEEHCANLLLALIGSHSAVGAAEGVKRCRDLPLKAKYERSSNIAWLVHLNENEEGKLGEIIARMIREWRRGYSILVSGYYLNAIVAWTDGEPRALLEVADSKMSIEELAAAYLWFYEGPEIGPRRVSLTHTGIISGEIIGYLADFLGPLESPEATK